MVDIKQERHARHAWEAYMQARRDRDNAQTTAEVVDAMDRAAAAYSRWVAAHFAACPHCGKRLTDD